MARNLLFCAAWRITEKSSWPTCTKISRFIRTIPLLACRRNKGSAAGNRRACRRRALGQRVDAWAAAQPPERWQKVAVRPGTKGELRVEAVQGRVWLWDGSEPKARCWHVLAFGGQLSQDDQVRPEQCLCGDVSGAACADAEAAVLDRALVRGRQERERYGRLSGTWLGAWHHHMALVMMAMLFMLEENSPTSRATLC